MSSGTVGFQGFGNTRALEFPDGQNAPVAPAGRGRIRYNANTNQFEGSVSGAVYETFGGGGGGGDATVPTIAALSALDDTAIDNGANIAVATVRDVFVLVKTSTLAIDGITVAATASGTGRWIRRELPSLAWANATTFFVDPLTGDDEATGATSGTALASWGEYARRVGELTIPVAQRVTLLSDLDEGIYPVRGYHPEGLTITAPLTQVATGTIDSVQAWDLDVTPVVDGRITEAGNDFTALEARLLRITSGAAAGNYAWVLKGDPDGVGVDTGRVGQWFDPTTFDVTNPSGGDDYEVLSQVLVQGSFQFLTRDVPGAGFVDIDNLHVTGNPGLPATPVFGQGGGLVATLCHLDSDAAFSGASFSAGTYDTSACLLSSTWSVTDVSSTVIHTCTYDGTFRLGRSCDVQFFGVCAAQIVVGGARETADVLRMSGGAQIGMVGGGLGGLDMGAVNQAVVSVDYFGLVRMFTSDGRLWSLNQGSGTYGMQIQAYAVASWPTTSGTFYRFDAAAAGAEEFQLGGTITDVATLGASGTIVAGNNAAAIQEAAI